MPKAKVFKVGSSQAVCLPAEFRLESDGVTACCDAATGNTSLSMSLPSWTAYFAWVTTLDLPADFLSDREQSSDILRDPFAMR